MKISASFLGLKEKTSENIIKLKNETDFLHVDVMDGEFVSHKTEDLELLKKILPLSSSFDVHLMVKDTLFYIEQYACLHPQYITVHLEAGNVLQAIDLLKSKNIKIGLSIKPGTSLQKIIPYLPLIDLVLIMSVEPGKSGQTFIENSVNKINELKRIREIYDYHYVIEVDGGINDRTAKLCESADILVVGSFITNCNHYEEQVMKIRKSLE